MGDFFAPVSTSSSGLGTQEICVSIFETDHLPCSVKQDVRQVKQSSDVQLTLLNMSSLLVLTNYSFTQLYQHNTNVHRVYNIYYGINPNEFAHNLYISMPGMQ